jgi:TetR/AcrR family transcriptional regulator
VNAMAWEERAVDNSAAVARARQRSIDRARGIVEATRKTTFEAREKYTVQQLAKLAGVSLHTFYRYFPSKDELLLALLEADARDGVEEMRRIAAEQDDHIERLRVIISAPLLVALRPGRSELGTRQHHRLAERFPAEVERIVQVYIDIVAETLAAAIEAGAVAPVDVAATARNIGLLGLSRYQHAAWGMFTEDVQQEADRLWAFCAHGLGLEREPGAGRARPPG